MLATGDSTQSVSSISPYLVANGSHVIVVETDERRNGLPKMAFGSMARDGGGLLLTEAERDALVSESPAAAGLLKNYVGAEEFLNGKRRFCLWVDDGQQESAQSIPSVRARSEKVALFRAASGASSTRNAASTPLQFVQRAHRPGTSIIVPAVSSERREYVPIGFLDDRTVISNAAFAIYDAEPWLSGLIQSRMHMVWMRAVAGRMESRYRYSATLVYNTFPVPPLTAADREALSAGALNILAVREASPGKTLAQMYDPDKMPASLKAAHEALDETVDRIYRPKAFTSDEERLEMLFELYETMIAEKDAADA